jgi:hypothetical protein
MTRQATGMAPTSFRLAMSREELRDGFVCVMLRSYTADAYFQRLDALFIDERFKFVLHQLPYWWSHPWAWTKRLMGNYLRFIIIAGRLLRSVEDDTLRSRYSTAIFARRRRPRVRAAHPIHLRHQGRDALSLRCACTCNGGGR